MHRSRRLNLFIDNVMELFRLRINLTVKNLSLNIMSRVLNSLKIETDFGCFHSCYVVLKIKNIKSTFGLSWIVQWPFQEPSPQEPSPGMDDTDVGDDLLILVTSFE